MQMTSYFLERFCSLMKENNKIKISIFFFYFKAGLLAPFYVQPRARVFIFRGWNEADDKAAGRNRASAVSHSPDGGWDWPPPPPASPTADTSSDIKRLCRSEVVKDCDK